MPRPVRFSYELELEESCGEEILELIDLDLEIGESAFGSSSGTET